MATLEEVKKRKKELRRNKRMIYNDDGAAISYYRTEYGFPVTESAFLGYSFGPHRGVGNHIVANPTPSDITTFVFNTGYPASTYHKSQIADVLFGPSTNTLGDVPDANPGRAITKIFDETGKDALQVAGEFLENEPVEFMFEMRVNDRHDASYDRNELVPLKQQLWDNGGLIKNGENNGLDFGTQESYDAALNIVLDVINRHETYKINGVCLNFYRHFGFFKNVFPEFSDTATTQAQIDKMTSFVETIVNAMDSVSQQLMDQGKEPLILLVKAADHPDFNRKCAVDLDNWMKTDLVDVFIPIGYHQFQNVRDSVAWGKSRGVSVVPSFQDVRLGDRRDRYTTEGKAGRFRQLLGAGGDGVEFFNWNYPKDPNYMGQSGSFWRNLTWDGILNTSSGARLYYQTWTNQSGGTIGTAGVIPVENFFPQYIPWVSEDRKKRLDGSFTLSVEIYESAEDITSATLQIYSEGIGSVTEATFNGNVVSLTSNAEGYSANLSSSLFIRGVNKVVLSGSDITIKDMSILVT